VATVSGTIINTNVSWSIVEGAAGGSITSGGIYTAPTTTGTFHVLAVSVADATASGEATVTRPTAQHLPPLHRGAAGLPPLGEAHKIAKITDAN
jgi:chitinase